MLLFLVEATQVTRNIARRFPTSSDDIMRPEVAELNPNLFSSVVITDMIKPFTAAPCKHEAILNRVNKMYALNFVIMSSLLSLISHTQSMYNVGFNDHYVGSTYQTNNLSHFLSML